MLLVSGISFNSKTNQKPVSKNTVSSNPNYVAKLNSQQAVDIVSFGSAKPKIKGLFNKDLLQALQKKYAGLKLKYRGVNHGDMVYVSKKSFNADKFKFFVPQPIMRPLGSLTHEPSLGELAKLAYDDTLFEAVNLSRYDIPTGNDPFTRCNDVSRAYQSRVKVKGPLLVRTNENYAKPRLSENQIKDFQKQLTYWLPQDGSTHISESSGNEKYILTRANSWGHRTKPFEVYVDKLK